MKKSFIKFTSAIGLTLVTLLTIVSCGDFEPVILDAPEGGFLQVESELGSFSESDTQTSIKVLYGGQSNDNGITVKYTLESDDPSRYVDVTGGTLEIPAGQFSGEIILQPVDNFATDGNLNIVLTLSSESSVAVGLAGGANNVSQTLTLIDDDCPISINDWVGTYTVQEVFSEGGVNAGLSLANAFGEAYQIELSLDPTDANGIRLIAKNSAGYNTYLDDNVVITFDTCSGTISFSQDPLNIALFAGLSISETSYTEGNFSMAVNGSLGNFGAYEFTLTKQ